MISPCSKPNSMKTTTIATTAALLALGLALPVCAQTTETSLNARIDARVGSTTVRAGAQASVEARIATAKQHADQEIERRITMLTALDTRVQQMGRVSSSAKSGTSATVQAQIDSLTALKATIDADSDIDTLKTDIKSIAASYRIFLLIIPQGRIEVAADKIQTTAASFSTFAGKLEARISALQTSGTDVTTLSASLADMQAKTADAQAKASAAVSASASLKPDDGDQSVQAANAAALKEARADIAAAMQDLRDARKDAGSIVAGIKSADGASVGASASSDASAGTQ